MQQGYFDPKEAEDQNTIVFVSHEHEDHFDPRIFSFRDEIKRIEYVLPEELDEIFLPLFLYTRICRSICPIAGLRP